MVSKEKNVGILGEPMRENMLTSYPSNFFLTVNREKVSWIFPGMTLLVSKMIVGKSAQICLNLRSDVLAERIVS